MGLEQIAVISNQKKMIELLTQIEKNTRRTK